MRYLLIFCSLLLLPLQIGAEDAVEDESGWEKIVYLASYPRSGNHWLRYLIEEATGIATSSVYCDSGMQEYERAHLPTMFPWGYCPRNGYEGTRRYPERDGFVVIKTHYPYLHAAPFDNRTHLKSICLIRHPVDCFFSHHLHNAPEGRVSVEAMRDFLFQWRKFHEYWQHEKKVLFIRYEDLYKSPYAALKKVLLHIGYKVKNDDIKRACKRYPPKGGIMKYRRHFDPEDLKIIEERLSDLLQRYHYKGKGPKGKGEGPKRPKRPKGPKKLATLFCGVTQY